MDCHYDKYCYFEEDEKDWILTKLLRIKNSMNFCCWNYLEFYKQFWKVTYRTCVKIPTKHRPVYFLYLFQLYLCTK